MFEKTSSVFLTGAGGMILGNVIYLLAGGTLGLKPWAIPHLVVRVELVMAGFALGVAFLVAIAFKPKEDCSSK